MDPSEQGDGHQGGPPREEELAWKVAMQRQMLEQQERQQHMQGAGPGGPPGPPGGPPAHEDELMQKVRQQQQLLDMEKQREVQQKMMEQQQLAMLEAQRGDQQPRMMPQGQGQQHMAPPGLPATGMPMQQQQQQQPPPPGSGPPQHPGIGPPGVVIPQVSGQGPSMMGQPSMSMSQSGPPQLSQAGGPPQMSQSGPPQMPPQMMQGGPHPSMSQGGPPQMMQQGGPPQMQQPGPPMPAQGGPPMPPHSQMGGQDGPPMQSSQGGPPQRMPPPLMSQKFRPAMGGGDQDQRGPPGGNFGPGDFGPRGGPGEFGGPRGPPDFANRGQQQGDFGPRGGPGDFDQRSGPGEFGSRGPPRDMDLRRGNHEFGNRDPPGDIDQRGPPVDEDFRRGGPPPSGEYGPGPPAGEYGPPRGSGPMGDVDHRDMDMRRPPHGEYGSRGPPGDMGPRPPQGDMGPRAPPGETANRGPQGSEEGNKPRQRGPYNGPNAPLLPRPNAPPSSQGGPKEMRLPQALEKILEFKSQRATELGVDPDNLESKDENNEGNLENEEEYFRKSVNEENNDDDFEDDENDVITDSQKQSKESKNRRKKKKKKKARRNRFEQSKKSKKKDKKSKQPDVQVEYVQEQLELDPADPSYHTFAKIFEAFKIEEPEKLKEIKAEDKMEVKKEDVLPKTKGIKDDDDDDDDDDDEQMDGDDDAPKISKKKLKKLTRLTVAQLKQLVTRPDVVEMHDVTARDPRLLVHLKATRNTVPVPRHWSFKRKYLQGKRGIEKAPFELPDFIKATGIEEMRAALQEKEDQKTLKSKMREKVRPKMGKIDIDYQKLHDAFFRFQTKPKMTIHGDLYYEAKEFETKLREKKPGNLSDDLRMALGMPIGASADKVPPPWLIAMQRYGPPPSYPNLKIAGLNAPIPEGCMFGYHAGGWGKPPVDELGKPLYGDVFGTQGGDFKNEVEEEEIDQTQWGELESESESEEESEEEEEEDKDDSGLITPAEGLMTPGGITSVPVGMETPDQIELRKKRIEDAMDQGGDTPALYQVLPEKKGGPVGAAMMGSAHVYDLSAAVQKKPGEKAGGAEAIEVSLNPEELDLDTAAMQAKYEQTVREQQSQLEKEDLSDMVAAHAAKQRKRKKAQQDTSKGAKKYKDFKF